VSARESFVEAMTSLLGMPVLWSAKGPDAYDCSGSVTACLLKAGGPDWRQTHNAQGLHDATRTLVHGELPLAGDLIFYGNGPDRIEHVAVYTADGGIISADGATSHIDPRKIGFNQALALTMANPSHRVRRHGSVRYRDDTPYIAVHRNTLVDQVDDVTR
jgi:cell wall-associated NlpC family hydrolase